MSVETEFLAVLQGAAAVTAIVGAGDDARIDPDLSPGEVTPPCIAFRRAATEYFGTLHAPATDARVSIECWCMAESREAADALGDAVQAAGAAAWFQPIARSAEYDDERRLWAAVLTFDRWE